MAVRVNTQTKGEFEARALGRLQRIGTLANGSSADRSGSRLPPTRLSSTTNVTRCTCRVTARDMLTACVREQYNLYLERQ